MLVQIFEYLDVTSTSATLPATKLVISHTDTLPGYGYNPYDDLRMTAFGVYGEDWANTQISALQNVRFSDKYSEDPAFQSITSLYISNSSANLAVTGITTNLKYETFAVSGIIPVSLDVSIALSTIDPQKFASAENVIALYEILLADARISDIADSSFSSLVEGSAITTYTDLTFESVYKNIPNVYSEYVKYAQITGTVSTSPSSISYSTLTLGMYANTPVNNLSSKSIDSYSIGIDGTGTNFVTDFSPNDVFVANNEYFKVESVANTTAMYIDRSPANTFSNVIAYKQISLSQLQSFDGTNITFDNQTFTFDQG